MPPMRKLQLLYKNFFLFNLSHKVKVVGMFHRFNSVPFFAISTLRRMTAEASLTAHQTEVAGKGVALQIFRISFHPERLSGNDRTRGWKMSGIIKRSSETSIKRLCLKAPAALKEDKAGDSGNVSGLGLSKSR
ncbi:hypothetical protein CEXT_275541 [Caerostris extrusa]|uniref:Uncharacterized protein n=1 Tax=Caerostris extrusa TaxID=172846 RepID=A0AAV4PEK4_CAEEX|nr:hypothetical protein CEXT_275541 [Caerostris extrusa]